MKNAEVQLPDEVYEQVKELAGRLRLTVPEVLRQAAEQMVVTQPPPRSTPAGNWQFPHGRHLGAFRRPAEDWRLLANGVAA